MAGLKRRPSPAPSQNYASSDPCSGNNKNGVGVKLVNWPRQFIEPTPNSFPPAPLSDGQQATVRNTGKPNSVLG